MIRKAIVPALVPALVAASVLISIPVASDAGTRQELDECSSTYQGVGGNGRKRVCPQPIVTNPQPATNSQKPQGRTNADEDS